MQTGQEHGARSWPLGSGMMRQRDVFRCRNRVSDVVCSV